MVNPLLKKNYKFSIIHYKSTIFYKNHVSSTMLLRVNPLFLWAIKAAGHPGHPGHLACGQSSKSPSLAPRPMPVIAAGRVELGGGLGSHNGKSNLLKFIHVKIYHGFHG
jgi:hypothetical protein